MSRQIVECVPNFSEGQDAEVIDKIASAIASVDGVSLLNIDPGEATNRTVMTFVGDASEVVEAAFRGVKCASELIDMRTQHGEHPRLGATDVLPLIPISGISLEECAMLARSLAKRISEELLIPTYCYQAAAFIPARENLAICRRGEYEALPQRVISVKDAPDFGARPYDEIIARAGAINVGAREFLIAVNFNLSTTSVATASAIAAEVRESGRPKEGVPGLLKSCKAIGWYIEEYGLAQVSMNLTDISITPLHRAFEEVSRAAQSRGVSVTGVEIIGLVPRRALTEAGRYFNGEKEATSEELIEVAIHKMRLDELRPFIPRERILEECMMAKEASIKKG